MEIKISLLTFIACLIGSAVGGFFLCICYVTFKIKKTFGITNLKRLEKQIRQTQEMKKKMKKGNLSEILKDPNFRKQLERLGI